MELVKLSTEKENQMYIDALEQSGVDNWEWYGEAMNKFGEMKKEALMELNSGNLVDEVQDFIVDNTKPDSEGAGLDYVSITATYEDILKFVDDLVGLKQKVEKLVEKEA